MVEDGDVWDWEESIWAVEIEETMSTTAQAPLIVQGLAPFEVEVAAPKPAFTVYKASSPIQCDTHAVPWDYNKREVNVEETDVATGVTRSGRIYTSENLLSKTSSQISILELLQSSETHQDALLKILGEAYVPSNITHGEVSQMVGQVFEAYKISFHKDELPLEGTTHNKALYISVQYQDKVINKALVDAGSGLNICPLSTLTRLGVDSAKIQTWKMNVRAFDGSQRGTIGEITLYMLIGPVTFPIAFQILDIPSSYNLLLGRPWIHMAGAVPSTLHQCLKFEWDYEEVVVHGEKGHPVYTIEGRENMDGEMYHTVELVGLGAQLQGIVKPIQLVRHSTTFGLGYKYTTEEWLDWQPPRDGYYYPLKKSIPPLYQSFRSAGFMGGSIDEISDDLKGLSLTKEEGKVCTIVINEEEKGGPSGSREAKISVSNWTSTPSKPRRASGKIHYKNVEYETTTYNETAQLNINDLEEVEDNEVPEELIKRVEEFKEKLNPNLVETEVVNLGNAEVIQETQVSIHMKKEDKKEYTEFLIENKDIFVWSYADMTGLCTSIVAHRLPTDPACPPVKQKLRKYKPEMSLKIKDEVSKQLDAGILQVTEYPTWLANVVPVPKKDGKVRVCVDYRDLNKDSPKDNFPLPNIHILIDNCAKHETQSFVDCFAGYHQIEMHKDDAEKTAFITPCGVYNYKVMPFGLKNAGATYMRAMTTLFHDIIHKEIEVYVDDVIIKSKESSNHLEDLRKFFARLRKYNLKLNPAKCVFGVPAGKLLGFIVSRRGIELDPSKIKAICDLPLPKSKKEVMSFLGRLNYISRFIAQSTVFCEPIFKLLKKDGAVKWTSECQQAFDKIKDYLSNPPVLVPPESEFRHVPRVQNEFADALATLSSMIRHPDHNYIDPIHIHIHEQPAYCFHVEEEPDGKHWYDDIRGYLKSGEYTEDATSVQKRTIRRLATQFFLSGEILYRRTPNLGMLRCVEAGEARRLVEEIHASTCGPHMNGFTLAKKILRSGYFWLSMETDCIRYVQKCRRQTHADMIRVPPIELHVTSSPWPFTAWGMDVIGPIEPTASNGHRFILVAIDYFTKWVEATSHKLVTKKVVDDFVKNNIICRFVIPESIITDNGTNLNSDLMRSEKLPFALLGYRTTIRTSTGATPYFLVYVTEAVIPAEVEIPSLTIIQEAKVSDADWIQGRAENLALIDGSRINAICHG
ncbi:uncharacterized protein [Solanum lycopersicum]|uniref:uncharacterized protein n=1 Tax=Solanum lycopersicum TaxID=4081 RepID=UPI003748AA65